MIYRIKCAFDAGYLKVSSNGATDRMRLRNTSNAGAEQQNSCPLCPLSGVCTGPARILDWHQRKDHPALGESLIQELTTQLLVDYRVCSVCLDIYSNSSRHSATCPRRHTTGIPSQQKEAQGSNQREGEPVSERPAPRTRKEKRRRTEATSGLKSTNSHRPNVRLHAQGVIP